MTKNNTVIENVMRSICYEICLNDSYLINRRAELGCDFDEFVEFFETTYAQTVAGTYKSAGMEPCRTLDEVMDDDVDVAKQICDQMCLIINHYRIGG